jgi:hypothetical protein
MPRKLSVSILGFLGLGAYALSLTPSSHAMQAIHAGCVSCDSNNKCQFTSSGGGQCVEWSDGSCDTTLSC